MKRSIKVVMVLDAWFPIHGGGQFHTWEIAKRLVRKGIKIDIITRALEDEEGRKFTQDESYFGGKLRIYRIKPVSKFETGLSRLLFLIEIIFILLNRNYDLIHAHSVLPGIPAKIASFIKRKPVVYTVHGTSLRVWKDIRKGILSPFFYWMERIVLLSIKYDAEISVSSDFLQYRNINKNIYVIPNGVEVSKFERVKVEKGSKMKILWVGRMDKIKALNYLIQAVPYIISRYKNVEFHLLGSGSQEGNWKKLVFEKKLAPYIFFVGRKTGKDLIWEYKSANIFVLPSFSEGMPLTLLEAWAAKLPVVVTKVGGMANLVKNEVNGYLVPPRNSHAIAKVIIKAIENRNLSKLGVNGFNLVKNYYSWDEVAEKTLRVYQSVLK